jgi:hypothetical protein
MVITGDEAACPPPEIPAPQAANAMLAVEQIKAMAIERREFT